MNYTPSLTDMMINESFGWYDSLRLLPAVSEGALDLLLYGEFPQHCSRGGGKSENTIHQFA